jgi:hypothetical protein
VPIIPATEEAEVGELDPSLVLGKKCKNQFEK